MSQSRKSQLFNPVFYVRLQVQSHPVCVRSGVMETKLNVNIRWQLSKCSWMGFWFWRQWKYEYIKCPSGMLLVWWIPFLLKHLLMRTFTVGIPSPRTDRLSMSPRFSAGMLIEVMTLLWRHIDETTLVVLVLFSDWTIYKRKLFGYFNEDFPRSAIIPVTEDISKCLVTTVIDTTRRNASESVSRLCLCCTNGLCNCSLLPQVKSL